MNWDDMSYDEQRAFLGLPDVRAYVAIRTLDNIGGALKEAFLPLVEAINQWHHSFQQWQIGTQQDYTGMEEP